MKIKSIMLFDPNLSSKTVHDYVCHPNLNIFMGKNAQGILVRNQILRQAPAFMAVGWKLVQTQCFYPGEPLFDPNPPEYPWLVGSKQDWEIAPKINMLNLNLDDKLREYIRGFLPDVEIEHKLLPFSNQDWHPDIMDSGPVTPPRFTYQDIQYAYQTKRNYGYACMLPTGLSKRLHLILALYHRLVLSSAVEVCWIDDLDAYLHPPETIHLLQRIPRAFPEVQFMIGVGTNMPTLIGDCQRIEI